MESCNLGNANIIRSGASLTSADRVALLASYSGDGSIKQHVEYYSKRLSDCGLRVILVIACDCLQDGQHVMEQDTSADFVILRDNRGFDFGSWSHAFKLIPALYDACGCLLTNDSLFGPFNSFDGVLARLFSLENQVDLISLTDNNEAMLHLQSYFMYISRQLLAAKCFRLFMNSVQSFESKSQIINLYEIPLGRFVSMSGFRAGALFRSSDMGITDKRNVTLTAWRELVRRGFPFVKIELLKNNPCDADITGWEQVLAESGYNPELVHNHLRARPGDLSEQDT
jgi:lipopolysaccharide biosynthesis protein